MANEIEGLREIIKLIGKMKGELKGADGLIVSLSKQVRASNGEFANLRLPKELEAQLNNSKTLTEQLNAQIKERNRVEKALQTALAKRTQVETQMNKELVKTRLETQILNKAIKEEAQLSSLLVGAYQKLTVQYNRQVSVVKNLVAANKQNTNEYRKAERELRRLERRIRSADKAANDFRKNVGNYPKVLGPAIRGLRSMAAAFGLTSGIFIFADVIRQSARVVREFDQAQANLAAVLGKSRDEIGLLTNQARILGETTAFTATQVSALQLELSKLGFNEEQILNATRGVEDLAIATGVDAARAAKLAGASLRGFALSASQSDRVAAALAVSTTKSANSFETLEVALPKVSAIAKAFGFTIEDTVALLGGLQNAGFEASIAGTSLRQIFLQLADANGGLAQELGGNAENFDQLIDQFAALEDRGIDLSKAFELTNARSVAAFKIFLQNAESVRELRNSIVDVNDELAELTETKLDSLQGRLTLLNSAWEGFILNLEDGNNILGRFLSKSIGQITENIQDLSIVLDDNLGFWERQQLIINGYTRTWQRFLPFIEDGNGLFAESTEKLKADNAARKASEQAIQAQINAFVKLNGSMAPLTQEQQKLNESADDFSIFVKQADKETEEFRRTLSFINGEIKRLGDAQQDLTATDKEAIGEISAKIKALKEERDAILNNTKASTDAVVILEGSIGHYEEIIANLEEKQKNLALTTEEYKSYNDQIGEAEAKIRLLRDGLEAYNKVQETQQRGIIATTIFTTEDIQTTSGEDAATALTNHRIAEEERANEAISALRNESLEGFENFTEDQKKILEDALDLQFELQQDFEEAKKELVFGSIDAIFQARIDDIDREIEASREKFNLLQEDENLNEAERQELRRQAEAEEQRLQRERDKREKAAFLVRQGIAIAEIALNLAKNITAINAAAAAMDLAFPFALGAVGAAYRAANLPIAIATAGLQTGLVVAQTIPQLEDGARNFEGGPAMVNDAKGGRFKELIQTPDGKLSMMEGRNAIVDLPKGTNVYNAQETEGILSGANNEILNRSFETHENQLNEVLYNLSIDKQDTALKNSIEEGIRNGFKNVKLLANINGVEREVNLIMEY